MNCLKRKIRSLRWLLLLLSIFSFSPSAKSQPPRSVLVGPIEVGSIESDSTTFDQPAINLTNGTRPDPAPVPNLPAPNSPVVNRSIENRSVTPQPIDAGEKVDALITKMVLQNIPHQFREDKDWGGQQSRWNGIDFRLDGMKVKTHRKKKMVNHGTWKKYEVSLLNPNEQFLISVKNMRESDDGKMAFDVHAAANLKIDGRQAKWIKGVQVFNVSVDGKTKIELVTTIELRTLMDMTKFPPDLVFRPEATAVQITVKDFRIDRISKVGGEVTQQISRLAQRAIEDRLKSEEAKTLNRINQQFADNAEKLKLSMHEAMSSKWSTAAEKFMPADVQNALSDQ